MPQPIKLTRLATLGKVPMLLFLFIASAFASVSLCQQRRYLFDINSLRIDPSDKVVPGEIVSLNVNYTTPILITEGTSKTTIRYHGFPLPPYTDSICSIMTCPIQPGTHMFTYKFQYPYSLPGRTTTNIIWYDSNATTFMCITISLTT
jgi:hypothetical protein